MALVAASGEPDDRKRVYVKLFSMSSEPGRRPQEIVLPEIKRDRAPGTSGNHVDMISTRTWNGGISGMNFNM